MTRTTLAGLTLALAALLGPNAGAQKANDKSNSNDNTKNDRSNDRDAGKRVTIRGVIAGVTVEGETAIDYSTHRAQVVEATFLTVVGSPTDASAGKASSYRNNDKDQSDQNRNSAGNRNNRHNVYVLWLSPKTEVRDGTNGREGDSNANDNNKGRGERGGGNAKGQADTNSERTNNAGVYGVPTNWEKLEVGDQVRITFTRREMSNSGGNAQQGQRAQKHGRHRTYFGEAASITILSMPDHNRNRDNNDNANNTGARDDDKDKVKKGDQDNDKKKDGK